MTKEVPRTSVLRDAELSISDATLIARLQNSKGWPTLGNAAADRIELLATTNEQLVATNEALSIANATLIAERDALFRRATLAEEWRDHDKTRAEAAEAKLATCEKYRDAYAEMGRIGTQAVRDLEAKLAECLERNALVEARLGKAVEALGYIESMAVHSGGEIHGVTALQWKVAFEEAQDVTRSVIAEIKSGVATTPYGLEGESQ